MFLRCMWLAVCLVLCAVAFAALTPAGGPLAGADRAMQPGRGATSSAGTADVVITGTVVTVEEPTPGDVTAPGGMNERGRMSVATIKVDEVIKGGKLSTVTLRYYNFANNKLTPNQQQIFLLKRIQDGYGFASGAFDVRPVGDADAVRKEIETYPLTIALKSDLTTVYFGQELPLTVVVGNQGATKVEVNPYNFFFEGFAASPRMPGNLPFRLVMPQPAGDVKAAPPAPIAIEPGQQKEFAVTMSCQAPLSWQFFPTDTYLQTPAYVRVSVRTNATRGDDGKFTAGLLASTPLSPIMVGYPLPDEADAD